MMDSIFNQDEQDHGKIDRGITEIDLENPNFNMLQYATVQHEINILPTKLNKKIIKNL